MNTKLTYLQQIDFIKYMKDIINMQSYTCKLLYSNSVVYCKIIYTEHCSISLKIFVSIC